MFLDGQLRALAEDRRNIVLRGEISRRLVRLETALALATARRSLADLTMGFGLAKWIIGRLGRR